MPSSTTTKAEHNAISFLWVILALAAACACVVDVRFAIRFLHSVAVLCMGGLFIREGCVNTKSFVHEVIAEWRVVKGKIWGEHRLDA